MNKIGFIISISITAIIFILEFVFAFLENQKVRKSIKPFCLISLMVSLFFFGLRHPLVYIALGCGLLGDIFLIWPKNKILFFLGIISFFINHILYIVLFSMLLSYTPPVWSIIALCALGILFPFVGYRILYQYTGTLTIPGLIYFYSLFMECLFAVLLLNDSKSIFAVMIFIGNLFFIGSDTTLTISNFMVNFKRKDFYIMITYLIAQSLIAFGLTLML